VCQDNTFVDPLLILSHHPGSHSTYCDLKVNTRGGGGGEEDEENINGEGGVSPTHDTTKKEGRPATQPLSYIYAFSVALYLTSCLLMNPSMRHHPMGEPAFMRAGLGARPRRPTTGSSTAA